MKVLSIRRVTHDRKHNAFTGLCWFKGNLYLGYRQGDAHKCKYGRIIILRSRDKGISWENVAVLRSKKDTRDAHLYTDGERLFAVSFSYDSNDRTKQAGYAMTENGDIWTQWQPYNGTESFVLWRPTFYNGTHYCAAYDDLSEKIVCWFTSSDGINWKNNGPIYKSEREMPNESYLEIRPDGTAKILMRCEGDMNHPYLCTAKFPFETWNMEKLTDISLTGPCLWTVDNNIYIGCRWHLTDLSRKKKLGPTHTAVFKIINGKSELQWVLPSGPGIDHSYIGVARWPDDKRRFFLSFYSDCLAHEDTSLTQWKDIFRADVIFGNHPDIFLADVIFD